MSDNRMKRIRTGSATLLLLVLALVLYAVPAAAAFGQMVVMQGEAVITREGKEISARAGQRITLEDGDQVRTLANSKAHITLGIKTLNSDAVLSENTTILVNVINLSRPVSPFVLAFGSPPRKTL